MKNDYKNEWYAWLNLYPVNNVNVSLVREISMDNTFSLIDLYNICPNFLHVVVALTVLAVTLNEC